MENIYQRQIDAWNMSSLPKHIPAKHYISISHRIIQQDMTCYAMPCHAMPLPNGTASVALYIAICPHTATRPNLLSTSNAASVT